MTLKELVLDYSAQINSKIVLSFLNQEVTKIVKTQNSNTIIAEVGIHSFKIKTDKKGQSKICKF